MNNLLSLGQKDDILDVSARLAGLTISAWVVENLFEYCGDKNRGEVTKARLSAFRNQLFGLSFLSGVSP